MLRLRTFGPLVALALAVGCAPFATYPPIEVASKLSPPEFEPFPTLMANAISYANHTYGDGGPGFAYNLPEGTPEQVYRMVAKRLAAGHPLTEPGVPAYHVHSVRARGSHGEVDLIHPLPGGFYGLVTLNYRNELGRGWQFMSARTWRLHVDAPAPSYVAPPDTAVAAAEPAAPHE